MTTYTQEKADAIANAVQNGGGQVVITMSVDARRGFLAELADHCASERAWPAKPFTDAAPGIVPSVASQFCTDPLGVFEQLVEAVYQRSRFCADELEWLIVRDLPTDEASRERTLGRLESDVDDLLDRLLGQALCGWHECTRQTGGEFCSVECANRAARSVGE